MLHHVESYMGIFPETVEFFLLFKFRDFFKITLIVSFKTLKTFCRVAYSAVNISKTFIEVWNYVFVIHIYNPSFCERHRCGYETVVLPQLLFS